MKLTRLPIIVLLLIVVLAAGCTNKPPLTVATPPAGATANANAATSALPAPTSPPLSLTAVAPETPAVSDLASLMDRLRAAGATVGQPAKLAGSVFSVQGNTLPINNAAVQVFEYSGDAAAQAEAARADSLTAARWVAPH